MGYAARMLLVAAGCALAAASMAAQWKQLAKGRAGELWIDAASIQRNNGEAAFDYRIDYPAPQQETGSKTSYRSTVTRAKVRCGARSLATGLTVAYAGARASGKVVGRYPPSPEDARFQPVQMGSSDENLWRHVCKLAEVKPQQ